MHSQLANQNPRNKLLRLSSAHQESLRGLYNRVVHVAPALSTMPHQALIRQDFARLEAQYLSSSPEILHFDNFLSKEALSRLWHFCTESTIWFDVKPDGYLGAYADDGFSSPLLYQIADELHAAFPRVFKGQELVHMWAYKYDSSEAGINIHADVAAVNVNFWITDEDANLDSSSGGLVVYAKQAPKDSEFTDFNSQKGLLKARQMIEADGKSNITVPYRQNRIVMFNSNLWHKTDSFHFKKAYRKRRINITMLFGERARKVA